MKGKPKNNSLLPIEVIERKIYLIRGNKVMLDADLASLYEVETFNLNKAIKRNISRFPADFMFQLNKQEFEGLRFQIGMSKDTRGGRRYLPYVFTEHGVAMLSSVLNSKKAIEVNILIIRAFIKLRELLSSHKDLILEIEKIRKDQKSQNNKIEAIMNVINGMLNPKIKENKEPMGFRYRRNKSKK